MRNLVTLSHISNSIESQLKSGETILGFTYRQQNGNIFVLTSSSRFIELDLATLGTLNVVREVSLEDVLPISDPAAIAIIDFRFVQELEGVVLVTNGGDIILISDTNEPECVGTVEGGLVGAQWSPDFEVLGLITGTGRIIVMVKEWDVIREEQIPDAAPLTASSKSSYSVTWRGDGKFFATSSKDKNGAHRIHTWERSGVLHSTCEAVSGLLPVVAWRPNGPLLASYQISANTNKHEVVFFERNGLRHGEFAMREVNGFVRVINMAFNLNDNILAILIEYADRTSLQFWTSSNWYWFLKQEYVFNKPQDKEALRLDWDLEVPMRCRLFSQKGQLNQFDLQFDYNISDGFSPNNPSIASVIDGRNLKLTYMKRAIVPPPMSEQTLPLPSNIRCVSYSHDDYRMALLLADGKIKIFEYNKVSNQTPSASSIDTRSLPTEKRSFERNEGGVDTSLIRQLIWISKNSLLGLCLGEHDGKKHETLVEINLDNDKESIVTTQIPKKITKIFTNKETSSIFYQCIDGSIWSYSANRAQPQERTKELAFENKIPSCPWIQSVQWDNQEVIVGLSDKWKLYVGGKLVCSDCSSFAIHCHFLIYSTLSHTLNFISLHRPLSQHEDEEGSRREVERGSVIVAVLPTDTKLVLQMPRGNLETIFPRPLLLYYIKSLLDKHEYNKAFVEMRKHRVDLNLLYDHNPKDFLENVRKIISQINNVDYLNLLISSMRDEDTTKKMIYDEKDKKKVVFSNAVLGKTNLICDAMIREFQAVDPSKYLLCMLTSYVRKLPPDLESPLALIRQLKEKEKEGSMDLAKENKAAEMKAESALKYLVFLCDVNALYDVALGMYDFELVILVAQKSQKDPKEYLPFLSSLQKENQYYQRYLIDKHLGRWEKALSNLHEAGDQYFQESLSLFTSKNLFYNPNVPPFFLPQPREDDTSNPNRKKVLLAYAEQEEKQGKFEESGYFYLRIGDPNKTFELWSESLSWKILFPLAIDQLKMNEEAIKKLAEEIGEKLQESNEHQQASQVYLTYAKDPRRAISSLLTGFHWTEAHQVAVQSKLEDLIQSQIVPSLHQSYDHFKRVIEDRVQQFQKHKTRLEIVIKNKTLLPQILGEKKEGDSETASQFSEDSNSSAFTSSTTTGSTMTAGGTRKRRGRKKRITGKEGSPFEHEFLTTSLNELIPSDRLKEEIEELIAMLRKFGSEDKANDLSQSFLSFHELIISTKELLAHPIQEDFLTPEQEEQNKKYIHGDGNISFAT